MGYQAAIAAVQALILTLPGIKQAPAYAPEQISEFPFSVAYPGSGTWEFGAGGSMKGLLSIVIEIHVARLNLPDDISNAMVYADIVPKILLQNPTLSGTVSTFGTIDHEFAPLGYGSSETIGFRWVIQNIKILSDIT